MRELELNVKGIACKGCENRIKNAIAEIKEVKEVNASCETCKVNVIFNKDVTEEVKQKVIDTIENLEFEVEK